MPPVVIDYQESIFNKDPESTAVNDMEDKAGTKNGSCPFVNLWFNWKKLFNQRIKSFESYCTQALD